MVAIHNSQPHHVGLLDLQLDRFESSEDESCGDVSSDEYENELVEVDDISQFGFSEAP